MKRILGALGVAAVLALAVPVSAQAEHSNYRHGSSSRMMHRPMGMHRMMRHRMYHHRMMNYHHRMMHRPM